MGLGAGDWAWAALDLLVPQECAGCGRPGRSWCAGCAVTTAGAPLVVPGPLRCRAAAAHAGPVARAVTAFKDSGTRSLARPLAGLLAAAALDVLADTGAARDGAEVWLVPVPARPRARRARGADHMEVLAGGAARALRRRGVRAHRLPALAHVRGSRDQVGLTRAERAANVAGTLAARPVPAGLLVVVDDVTTTGATLAEAARALRAATGRCALAAAVTWAGTPASRLGFRGTSV